MVNEVFEGEKQVISFQELIFQEGMDKQIGKKEINMEIMIFIECFFIIFILLKEYIRFNSMGKKNQTAKRASKFDLVFQGNDRTHYKEKLIVSFKPIKKQPILPVFNQDKKPFTPAFYLPALYNPSDDRDRESEFKLRVAQL